MIDHDVCEDRLDVPPARFQEDLTGLLDWLAARDPERAASLLGEYLDDLAAETNATASSSS